MKVNCEVVEKTSKLGSKYVALEIEISPNYKKIVFLTKAELELLKAIYSNK